MPLDPRLLEILICPACHGGIAVINDEAGLECQSCGRVYPVRDGIPVMLVEEASSPTRSPGKE
jgi:uncharacterized protein YbaR (Trm112 family)